MSKFTEENWLDLGHNILVILIAIAVAKLLQVLILKMFFRVGGWFHWQLNENLEAYGRKPLLYFLMFSLAAIALHFTSVRDEWIAQIQLVLYVLATASTGWLAIGIARGMGAWLEEHYAAQSRDPLGTRRFGTQIRVLMRVVIAIIVILTAIGIALVIPGLRKLGMSLFASAGVASLVIGMAANSTLANLFAGIQIAITQPILLGDEVVINNQTGIIEEIGSSYVVIRLADLRRLIAPLNYFMTNSFINATYHDPALLGNVTFNVDYAADINAIRQDLEKIVKASHKWDQKTCNLKVSDNKDDKLELTAQISARNSSDLSDLQSEVREKLVIPLQNKAKAV